MAASRRFAVWTTDSMRDGVHNHSDHDFHVYLTNDTISSADRATKQLKSEIPEIALGNGYAGSVDILNTFTNVGKIYTFFGRSFSIVAAGGDIGPFRHVVLFNFETSVKVDPLLFNYDHGNNFTILDGTTHEILCGGAPVGQDGQLLQIFSVI